MATYVIPDTHGCLLTLRHLLEVKLSVSQADKLYFLGDYIDRGPLSAQLIDYLIDLRDKGYTVNAIRGNHEQMLLDSITSKKDYKNWILNTGYQTIKSYRDLLGATIEFPYDIPEKHMSFYKALPHFLQVGKYVLIHGGINYSASDPFADTESLLWSRAEPVPTNYMPGTIIIGGHTPTPLVDIQRIVSDPNSRFIPLDGGCVYAGKYAGCGYLVALELDTMNLHWVKSTDN